MKRIDAVKQIMQSIKTEFIISSCGMISREVYAVKDRPENFYVMGAMGSTLGIGIGLALNTDRKVVVIVGDGEILMSLGTLVLMNKLKLPNLRLVILDNGCYQSAGGQKTCSDAVNFSNMCDCEVMKVDPESEEVPRIPLPHEEIARRFYHAINGM